MDRRAAAFRLDVPARLLGAWEVSVESGCEGVSAGLASFEWVPGRQFILHRWTLDRHDAADGVALIGADASGQGYLLHSFDSHGVAQVFWMEFEDGTWSLERTVGDFSPLVLARRFRASMSDDGTVIDGVWESSPDAVTWTHESAVSYSRIGN